MNEGVVNLLHGATIRALSNQSALAVYGSDVYFHHQKQMAPCHLRFDASFESSNRLKRGKFDAMAQRKRYSDPMLHAQLQPEEPIARLIFDALEQLRTEALYSKAHKGLKANLRHNFHHWSVHPSTAKLFDDQVGVLLFTVIQIIWSRLNRHSVFTDVEEIVEVTRSGIAPLIGHALKCLNKQTRDQMKFAEHALEIAHIINDLVQQEQVSKNENKKVPTALNFWFDDEQASEFLDALTTQSSKTLAKNANHYQIFTTDFDIETDITSMVRPEALIKFRKQLSDFQQLNPINTKWLSKQLRDIFQVHPEPYLQSGHTAGYVDGAKLNQVVFSPLQQDVFKYPENQLITQAHLCLLVDCSGSIKAHRTWIASWIDYFIQAAEAAGIKTEVLGFTTTTWQGGRVREAWQKSGSPPNPGRLNELCHICFKSEHTPWRKAKKALAGLLKADLYKESIDGESIEWACKRALTKATKPHLLIISDQCPMDSFTLSHNPANLLTNHIIEVLNRYQNQLNICGIGVGEALPEYYNRQLTYEDTTNLNNRHYKQLLNQLISR